jgi:hypothetical protein
LSVARKMDLAWLRDVKKILIRRSKKENFGLQQDTDLESLTLEETYAFIQRGFAIWLNRQPASVIENEINDVLKLYRSSPMLKDSC